MIRHALPLLLITAALSAADGPWPAPVPGFQAPAAGEHPRLFFRKADLPNLKKRAATPDGQKILARLRFLLNGGDGETLPPTDNPFKGRPTASSPSESANSPHGSMLTLIHPAGYGMLFHLTGDRKYADLAKQATEKILDGTRDRDNRYGFRQPHGALRAGPSLGAMAWNYDLCYDGWDDAFRQKVALAIQNYDEGEFCSLPELAAGKRHVPTSNHWGCQVGGAALALLAIRGDPGVDNAKIEKLLEVSQESMRTQLSKGFGDGGFFYEGQGASQIGSDTAFIPALQAWRVAAGLDFVTPSRTAWMITMIRVYELMARPKGGYYYPLYGGSSYGTENFERGEKPTKGWSNAGQFVQGLGAVLPDQRGALMWTYNHIIEPDPAKYTYDTVNPYPHRAILALVNWPIGEPEVNPAQVKSLPRVLHDTMHHYVVFRNRWQDANDILVTGLWGARDDVSKRPVAVWGLGERMDWKIGSPQKQSTVTGVKPDGSGVVTCGPFSLGVDFSKASGADALLVATGAGVSAPPSGKKAKGGSVQVGGATLHWLALSESGTYPEVKADADALVAGGQRVTLKSGTLAFEK